MKGSKKLLIVAAAALVILLGSVAVAYAITNGQPDGDAHPYVGMVAFYNDEGEYQGRCSGSLLSPTVLLTAGHCTSAGTRARVWFDSDLTELVYPYPDCGPYDCWEGTSHTNPDYRSPDNPYGGGNGLPAFSYRDVGVVVLDEPVDLGGFVTLPEAGLVDTLKNKTDIDFVGYGVQYQAQIPGNQLPQPPPYFRWTGLRARMYAPSELVSGKFVHSAEYMRLALNPGGGKGGTCFGDSGGPDLLGGTDTVLAVNSYVTNVNCAGVGYSSRVDIPEILAWINTYLN